MVSISVIDRETGQVLPTYQHDGRLYVAGRTGDRYSIRITNKTNGRVKVLTSVDGLNIVSGEPADYYGIGYILDKDNSRDELSVDINGWRKSQEEIAVFRFAPLPQSYAARTGRPGEVGVIGVAVFKEIVPPPPPPPPPPPAPPSVPVTGYYTTRGLPPPPPPPPPAPPAIESRSNAQIVVTASMSHTDNDYPSDTGDSTARNHSAKAQKLANAKLGTAHGEIEQNHVRIIPFNYNRGHPDSVRIIEYDSMDNLIAHGVVPASQPIGHRPEAFPATPEHKGYVPDPPAEKH